MNIVAHIRELVVEGDASFNAADFRERLAEQLAALTDQEQSFGSSELVVHELVVCANANLRDAAREAARALFVQLRKADR